MITQQRVKELIVYDEISGVFKWLKNRTGFAKEGGVAGSLVKAGKNKGYIVIQLDGEKYQAHRLAWLYHYGLMPEGVIDHINTVRNDNSIRNLRIANNHENGWNSGVQKNNRSGCTGVIWSKNLNKWIARINNKHLGLFGSLIDAASARKSAEISVFGEFQYKGVSHE